MDKAALLFLGFIVIQRLSELLIARHNTRRLLERGAYEVGAGHYPAMVAMHALWIGCLVVFGYDQPVSYGWLVIFAILQIMRVWILATLGKRWTTRIIISRTALVAHGPFKYLRHPNYTLVVAEIIVAPMVLGLIWVAVLFTLANAAMLWVRITCENAALRSMRAM